MSCSPPPRQTKSTSGHCSFTKGAFKVARGSPLIGDAKAPRQIGEAVRDGHAVAREI
jgi:hypothetical protein